MKTTISVFDARPEAIKVALRQNRVERVCENIARFSFLSLIVLATWLGSGTRVEFLMPMFFTASTTFIFCGFARLFSISDAYFKMLSVAFIFFAIVCVTAHFNPFLESVNGERCRVSIHLDYIKWLPTSARASFDYGNSLRSLCILSTSLFATMSACVLFKRQKFAVTALVWFAINSCLMGVYAIYQKAEDIPVVYGIFHSQSGFYGSFFLGNAAGAFLNMGLAACGACAIIFALRRSYWLFALFATMALITSLASWYSESKGAQMLCALQWALFAYLSFCFFIKRQFATAIIRVLLILPITIGALVAGYFAYNTYSEKHKGDDTISFSLNSRIQIYKNVIEEIKDYPIWGVGGECSRFILTKNTPTTIKETFVFITDRPHSDILEYILDYGLLGSIVFALSGIFFCGELFLRRARLSLANYCALIGVSLCFLHGAFDMELHIPSTMIAFGIMTAWSYAELKNEQDL